MFISRLRSVSALSAKRTLRSFSSFQSNVSSSVSSKVGRNLHLQPKHPLNILKKLIEDHFAKTYRSPAGTPIFKVFDDLSPKVTVTQNFDELLVKPDHPSRRPSDTFYFDANHVLRTHTSAHQNELMRAGNEAFLVFGDCYRRDEIDATHYPVFHQIEGVRVFNKSEVSPGNVNQVVDELKGTLEGLVTTIFGKVEKRWVDAYFPFTQPSFELEVFYNNKWLEVLGSGVIERQIIRNCGMEDRLGWAFGIGLERLAMALFDIPDIRLFWSQDPRFLNQFASGRVIKFEPFSKYPPCTKDISFWLPESFHDNDLFCIVREVAGDLVENVSLIDEFKHPKTGRESKCFRITYRSLERTLTNAEIDVLQEAVRQKCVAGGYQLR